MKKSEVMALLGGAIMQNEGLEGDATSVQKQSVLNAALARIDKYPTVDKVLKRNAKTGEPEEVEEGEMKLGTLRDLIKAGADDVIRGFKEGCHGHAKELQALLPNE
jgi:hypothetical protein